MMLLAYLASVWITAAALTVTTVVYGVLTPWTKSRTGIGFFLLLVSLSVIVCLTLYGFYGRPVHMFVGIAAWLFVAFAVLFGVLWNIIYKQFIEGRSERVSDTRQNHSGKHLSQMSDEEV